MTQLSANSFILTPFFLGQALPGLESLYQPGWGRNLPRVEGTDPLARIVSVYAPLAARVQRLLEQGKRPVSISGDCCSALAVLAGLQAAGVDPFVIWFDAHGDFNTSETSPSGFLGGMPLAMLVGRGDQRLAEGVGLRPQIEERVILSDARDLDPLERPAVESSGIRHFESIEDLIGEPLPEGPLYVHFDTDIVSATEVPAQNYCAPGGAKSAEVAAVFRRLARSGRVVAVSVSTWNPELDPDGRSRRVSMALLDELVGGTEA